MDLGKLNLDTFVANIKACSDDIEKRCEGLDEKTAKAVKDFGLEFAMEIAKLSLTFNSKYPGVNDLLVFTHVLEIQANNYRNFLNSVQGK